MYSRTVTRDIAGYWSNFRCRLWVTVLTFLLRDCEIWLEETTDIVLLASCL